jgi:hypothetical protein
MGEGKSTALCWSALHHTRHNPGAHWVLIRDTFENIQKTTMKTFFQWFPPGIYGSYHAGKKEFTWAEGVAKGTVGFMGMDDPTDASKLMSMEIAGFGIDEPAPAVGSAGVDETVFDIAMSRLRQPGMKWYGAKLAENNPDEAHWTYTRFVSPGEKGFVLWQPNSPENLNNLPSSYYEGLRRVFAHRPDLVRRFVEGEFGFQSVGKAVTPQWNDRIHLANALVPEPRGELFLLWDFGHTPTCIITQRTASGHWLVLDAQVGDGIGVSELISDWVRPLLTERYGMRPGRSVYTLRHIGDPAGKTAEASSIVSSPVRTILRDLGGTWRDGPIKVPERVEPLRAVLARMTGGKAVVQVDKHRAAVVWMALRGGWHYHITRTGITAGEPAKNIHSHPGDAMGYGAAVLFPMGRMQDKVGGLRPREATYWGRGLQIGPGPGRMPTPGSAPLWPK